MAQTNQIAAFLGLKNRNSRSSVLNISAEGSNQRAFTMLSWTSFASKLVALVPDIKSKTTRFGEPYLQHGYIAFFSQQAFEAYKAEPNVKDVALHNLIDSGQAKWVKTSADLDALLTANPKYEVAANTDIRNHNHNAVENLLDDFILSVKDQILVSEREHEVYLGLSKLSAEVRESKLLANPQSSAEVKTDSDKK